jgi:NIPSNAP
MKRRSFIQASLAVLGTAAVEATTASAAEAPATEFYELRVYTLKAAKQPILDDYLEKAFLPALKRTGIGPVGVFVEKGKEDVSRVHVLIVYSSADQFANLTKRLAADESYQKAAADYLAAPASDPVYTRIESSLLRSIEGMPRLEKPDASRPRLLNLRIYESHNERAGKKKIEMFNKAELAIFRRTGLTPVFFGETILGSAMPNLTYMLVFPDEAGRKAAWSRFIDDAEWKKLRAIPEYADKEIVSHITNKILTPASYSEI